MGQSGAMISKFSIGPPPPWVAGIALFFLGLTSIPNGVAEPIGPEAALDKIANESDNVGSRLNQLTKEFQKPKATSERVNIERRLVDATVFYGLGDYSKASILFFDLLRSKSFRTHSRYLDTKFKLGICHFRAKNYRAAQTVLADLARVRSNFQQDAIILLVESSLNLGDDEKLDQLLGQIAKIGRSAKGGLRYVEGKALYRRGKLSAAKAAFGSVSPREAQYGAARYYRGVVFTGEKTLNSAKTEFLLAVSSKEVVGTSPLGLDEDYAEVRQLARLALARIALEERNTTVALRYYQDIDRHSPSFEVALYEMAWVMLEEERYDQALHTLDVLILIAKEGRILADANVMKSRLLMQLKRYEEASKGYTAVLDDFSPIQRELERMARSDQRLDEYFEWLIDRNVSGFDIQRPMTERASHFVERSVTIRPVASVFDQLGVEESTIDEAEVVARELEAALTGNKRYDLVPVLAERWGRLGRAENKLIAMRSHLLDVEQGLVLQGAKESVAQESRDRANRRHVLELKFEADAPNGTVDYVAREKALERKFRSIERESFLARQLLEGARKQLNAVEVWLNDSNQTGLEPGGFGERKARMLLEDERKRLAVLHEELIETSKDIDLQSIQIGIVDMDDNAVGGLKAELLRLQDEERAWSRPHLKSAESRSPLLVQKIRKIRRKVRAHFGSVSSLHKSLDKALEVDLKRFATELARERSRLARYEEELNVELKRSRSFVREHGYELFRSASGELRQVVLEADVGLIDVSWERKFQEGTRIQTLMEERNSRLRDLDESLEEISRDRKTGLVPPEESQSSGEEEGGL